MYNSARAHMRRLIAVPSLALVGLAAFTSVARALPVLAAHGVARSVDETVNTIAGARLFLDADNPARKAADAWRRSRPREAALLDRIAAQPVGRWFGGWLPNVRQSVSEVTAQAAMHGTVPVLVAYNIPNRDCGHHSAGGERNAKSYGRWIRDFAAGIKGQPIVIVEPDGVALLGCLSPKGREERLASIRDAVQVLKSAGARVYIDAGNAEWMSADSMAHLLGKAGIAEADGFALNVANFLPTSVNVKFGNALSARVGGKRYVIDTSRNGAGGVRGGWCNVPNQALGAFPTTRTGHALVDAFLWVKRPGESDGRCEGGPDAGTFWPEYALGLAQRAESRLAAR